MASPGPGPCRLQRWSFEGHETLLRRANEIYERDVTAAEHGAHLQRHVPSLVQVSCRCRPPRRIGNVTRGSETSGVQGGHRDAA